MLFLETFGPADAPIHTFHAPGRVNLIGEHLDYNGGTVLPMAIGRGITAHVRANGTRQVRLASQGFEGMRVLDFENLTDLVQHNEWHDYPAGVVLQCFADGMRIPGLDILFTSDLPTGAGLSSSAAIQVLTGYVLHHFVSGRVDRPALAMLAQRVENQFIGVACGIMDPYIIAMAQAGSAMLLNCTALTYQYVPFTPDAHQLMVLDTGVSRALVDGEYNSRRIVCERAFRRLSQQYPLANLASASLAQVEKGLTDPEELRLARHVVTEQARVHAAAHALRLTNWEEFGRLLDASHASLRDDFQVTGPALDAIVTAAQAHPACVGARMTGAGFAGSAIALVQTEAVEAFTKEVTETYTAQTGHTPNLFAVESAGAVK